MGVCKHSLGLQWNGLLVRLLTEWMTRRSLSGSHNKSWWNSPNANERCFDSSFLISFSLGYTEPSCTRGKERRLCRHTIPRDSNIEIMWTIILIMIHADDMSRRESAHELPVSTEHAFSFTCVTDSLYIFVHLNSNLGNKVIFFTGSSTIL